MAKIAKHDGASVQIAAHAKQSAFTDVIAIEEVISVLIQPLVEGCMLRLDDTMLAVGATDPIQPAVPSTVDSMVCRTPGMSIAANLDVLRDCLDHLGPAFEQRDGVGSSILDEPAAGSSRKWDVWRKPEVDFCLT